MSQKRITGRVSLLALIDQEKAAQGLSDAELLRRAGLSGPVLNIMRNKPNRRSLNLATALALLNTLGFDLVAERSAPE